MIDFCNDRTYIKLELPETSYSSGMSVTFEYFVQMSKYPRMPIKFKPNETTAHGAKVSFGAPCRTMYLWQFSALCDREVAEDALFLCEEHKARRDARRPSVETAITLTDCIQVVSQRDGPLLRRKAPAPFNEEAIRQGRRIYYGMFKTWIIDWPEPVLEGGFSVVSFSLEEINELVTP